QTHSQPPRGPRGAEQVRELLERAPQRAPGARGVFEMEIAALGLGQRLLDPLPGALYRLADVALLRRSGMQDDADRADAAPDAKGLDQRGQRLPADRGIFRATVEEVHRVDQDGVDRTGLTRLAKGREVVFAVR